MATEQQSHGMHSHYQSAIITDSPGPSESGTISIVKRFINNQGANLVLGDAVKIDTTGNDRIIKATTLGDLGVIGVVAAAGPFANGASTPVVIFGYHPSIKATGTIARGDYLQCSNTDGTVETMAIAGAGIFGRAVAASSGGFVAGIIFDPSLGAGAGGAATQLHETGGPTDLNIAAIADGKYLRRVGTNVVGGTPPGSVEYSPLNAPSSPNAVNDEFDDLSIAGAWTTASSGGGSSGTIDETLRKGYIRLPVTDGGAGSSRSMWKNWTAPSGIWTLCAHGFGNVGGAGSNQVNLEVYTGAGSWVFTCGMLQGNSWMINHPGGFSSHSRPGITGNTNEFWLIIHHDSGSGIDGWISADGMVWTRLTGVGGTAAVGRIQLSVWAFSASFCEGWYDFVRAFHGVEDFTVGGVP